MLIPWLSTLAALLKSHSFFAFFYFQPMRPLEKLAASSSKNAMGPEKQTFSLSASEITRAPG
jgi:hypothetical protein